MSYTERKGRKLMSKRIIAMIASFAVLVGLMNCGTSYAWFVTTLEKKQSISVSVISTSQSAKLTDLESDDVAIIMPGDNLVSLDGQEAMLRIDNESTTDVQLRISIEYTSYASGKAEQKLYSGIDDDIIVTFAENKWSKNVNASGACYFYYMGDEYTADSITSIDTVPSINPEISSVDAISSIVYKDDISKSYSGQPVNIKIRFESKQADNVSWSSIDEFEVSGKTV